MLSQYNFNRIYGSHLYILRTVLWFVAYQSVLLLSPRCIFSRICLDLAFFWLQKFTICSQHTYSKSYHMLVSGRFEILPFRPNQNMIRKHSVLGYHSLLVLGAMEYNQPIGNHKVFRDRLNIGTCGTHLYMLTTVLWFVASQPLLLLSPISIYSRNCLHLVQYWLHKFAIYSGHTYKES